MHVELRLRVILVVAAEEVVVAVVEAAVVVEAVAVVEVDDSLQNGGFCIVCIICIRKT